MKVSVELVDDFFNRRPRQSRTEAWRGHPQAKDTAAIDRLLADQSPESLKLSSATTFRHTATGFFRLANGPGWDATATRELKLGNRDAGTLLKGSTLQIK